MKTVIKKTLNKIWKLCRLPSLRKEEVPWCAGFVGGYLERYRIQSDEEIVMCWRDNRYSGSGHVGFVSGPLDGRFIPIQNNKVLLRKENSYV